MSSRVNFIIVDDVGGSHRGNWEMVLKSLEFRELVIVYILFNISQLILGFLQCICLY